VYGRDRPSGSEGSRRASLYFPAVNAEFNWWLLLVGLVVGAGLAWFVVMDTRRRDVDIDERERPREALWLSRMLADEGHRISPEAAERLLMLHRAYLEAPPPDEPEPVPVDPATASATSSAPATASAPATDGSELADDDGVPVEGRAPDVRQ
jgi:hypothetical protein